jgi:hypothetical protein
MASRIRPGDLEDRAKRRCSGQQLLTALAAAPRTTKALTDSGAAPPATTTNGNEDDVCGQAAVSTGAARPPKRARDQDGEGAARQAQAAGTLWQYFSR